MAGGKGWLLVGVCMLALPGLVWAQGCAESALHTEFFTDPTQRLYSACSSDGDLANPNTTSDACVQEKLNAPCTNNAACKTPNILTREQILQTIIDPTDLETFARATAANDLARKSELDWLLTVSAWDMSKAHNQQLWKNVFPSSYTTTNAAINAAQLRDASRCEIVCKKGNGCTLSDTSLGLRGTP